MMTGKESRQTEIVSKTIWQQMAKIQWIAIIHFMVINTHELNMPSLQYNYQITKAKPSANPPQEAHVHIKTWIIGS